MRYRLEIEHKVTGVRLDSTYDTRAELSADIDIYLRTHPKADGWQYTATCEVIRRYTLLDADVTTGDATQAGLWDMATCGHGSLY